MTITLTFNQGTASPPQLGTMILKPAPQGFMGYSQNVSTGTDLYGNNVVVPGYYFAPFSSSLVSPFYWKALDNTTTGGPGNKMWLGYYQSSATIAGSLDYIDGIASGSTPTFVNNDTVKFSIGGYVPQIGDIQGGQELSAIGTYIFASLYDAGGSGRAWITAFQNSTSIVGYVGLTTAVNPGVIQNLPMIRTQFDKFIYIGNGQTIDRVDPSNASLSVGTTLNAVGTPFAVPYPWYISALGEWNGLLVAACNNEQSGTMAGDFSKRNGGGQSRVFFWDIANSPTANYKANFVNSPSHYISVLFTDLSGNLLAFGGVDEGRSTIYQYNGYGFVPLFSYIGELPRNRHSVCFDAQGRLMWQTASGQICRLNSSQVIAVSDEEQSGTFEHLSTLLNSNIQGGILANLQASGYEFVASTGTLTASDSYLSYSQITKFIGNPSPGFNTYQDPVAISGIQVFPPKSVITDVQVSLNKPLQSGDSLNVYMYPSSISNYTAGTLIGSLDYAIDGGVAIKHLRTLQTNVDEAAFGVVWTTALGTSSAPGLMKMDIEAQQLTVL